MIYENGFKFESPFKITEMKKILLFLIVISAGFAVKAQDLAPDQNPNYKVSMAKYTTMHDNLQKTMNTTSQNTYKAYDFTTAKAERRAERRNYRRERSLYYDYNYYNGYNGYNYYQPGYNNNNFNFYGNRYRYDSRSRRWWRP